MLAVVTRKTFWDFWDNIVVVFVGNLIIVAVLLTATLGVGALTRFGPAAVVPAVFVAAVAVSVLLAAQAVVLGVLIRRAEWQTDTVVRQVLGVVPMAVFIAATTVGLIGGVGWLVVAASVAGPLLSVVAVIGGLWVALMWLQIAGFALVARAAAGRDTTAALRDAAMVAFDNPAYGAAVTAFAALLLCFIVIIVPGPGAVLILLDNAFCLRWRKYAAAGPGPADWDRLLAEERRQLARRTPRSILFPWRS